MFTAQKIESTIAPVKFDSLGNGNWYYNYGIETYTVTTADMEGKEIEETRYSYVQVKTVGIPTSQKCIKAILESFVDESGNSLYPLYGASYTIDREVSYQIEDIVYNIQVDFDEAEPLSDLEQAKKTVTRKIEDYDTSAEVNSFYLNGNQVWLDKSTRVGLMNSLDIEKESGKTESTLWFNGISLTIPIDTAVQMLSSLELYALNCYNVTANHKANITALTTVDEVNSYDYTTGYPEKLNLTIE